MSSRPLNPVPRLENLEARLTPAANPAVVQVQNLYGVVLRREPDIGGWTHFVDKVDAGTGLGTVSAALVRSGEFADGMVEELFRSLLRRDADAWGRAGFSKALQAGQSLERATAAILASGERSGSLNDDQFISEMYYVILNRQPDAAGAQAMGRALAGGASRADVALAMLESPEASQRIAANLYRALLGRAGSAQEVSAWAVQLAAPGFGICDAISAFAGSDEGSARLATPDAAASAPAEFWWEGFVGVSTEAARREVQRISGQMSEVMRQRRAALDASQPVESFDQRLEELDAERNQALCKVVLAENPQATEVDRAKRVFSLPVPGSPSGDLKGYSSPLVAWNAENLPAVNGQFQALIRGPGPNPDQIWSNQSLGGSTNFSSFYKYPGDFDFPEQWNISAAPDADTAAAWITQGIIDFAAHQDQVKLPNLEVLFLSVNNVIWTNAQLLQARTDTARFDALKNAIRDINNGNLYLSFYGVLDDGRITHMQKVISVNAKGPGGEELFASNPNWAWYLADDLDDELPQSGDYFQSRAIASYFQEVYVVNGPSTLDPVRLGAYAEIMHNEAMKEVNVKKNYMKAANRAFSYVRTIGDQEGMEAFKPVFQSKYLEMNQRNAMLDAINLVLSGKCSTRLLTVGKTKEMLYIAARDLEPLAGGLYSAQLRDMANQLGATESGLGTPLTPDSAKSAQMSAIKSNIAWALNNAVMTIVVPNVQEYVENYGRPELTQAS